MGQIKVPTWTQYLFLQNKVKPSSRIYCCFPEMEERTGKKPREANWKREGERQENDREGKGGEKGQKRSMEHS